MKMNWSHLACVHVTSILTHSKRARVSVVGTPDTENHIIENRVWAFLLVGTQVNVTKSYFQGNFNESPMLYGGAAFSPCERLTTKIWLKCWAGPAYYFTRLTYIQMKERASTQWWHGEQKTSKGRKLQNINTCKTQQMVLF